MRYALLVCDDENASLSDERRQERFAAYIAFQDELEARGMLVSRERLRPTASSTTVRIRDVGWGTPRTIGELAAAIGLLIAFVVNEQRHRNPLVPFSICRIKGLAAADATQVIAQAGFYTMFFFITLYMQNVLGFSPIQARAAYVPVTIGVGLASGVSMQLLSRTGTRPIIVAGTLLGAGGVYWLSRIPVHGSYASDILPGLVVMAIGLGAVFVGVQTAANAGVPADKAGLAAALISTSSTLGGALGLAIFSAIATSRTHHLLAAHTSAPEAITSGFQRALMPGSLFLLAAAVIAARATNTRGEPAPSPTPARVPVTVPDAA
jgi:predicted MFS family arabinose efflux permease